MEEGKFILVIQTATSWLIVTFQSSSELHWRDRVKSIMKNDEMTRVMTFIGFKFD